MRKTKESYKSRDDIRSALDKCQAENKALETKNLEITEKYNSMCDKRMELMGRYNTIKESRDELLEELKLARAGFKSVLIDTAIKKAEAEKETE